MSKTTTLATSRIAAADIITIQLVEPSDSPSVVFIRWPSQPTVSDPYRFQAVINSVMSVLAAAAGKLATIRPPE